MRPSSLGAFVAAVLLTGVSPLLAAHEVAAEDIIEMSQSGLSDGTILRFIEKYDVCIPLSSRDLSRMAEGGISSELIETLIDYMASCQEGVPFAVYPAPVYPPVFYSSSYLRPSLFSSVFFFDHHDLLHLHHGFHSRHDVLHHPFHRGAFHHPIQHHDKSHEGFERHHLNAAHRAGRHTNDGHREHSGAHSRGHLVSADNSRHGTVHARKGHPARASRVHSSARLGRRAHRGADARRPATHRLTHGAHPSHRAHAKSIHRGSRASPRAHAKSIHRGPSRASPRGGHHGSGHGHAGHGGHGAGHGSR